MICTAADPGDRGGAECRDLAGPQARTCANFGAGAPGQMFRCEEKSTPGGGRRPHADLPDYARQRRGEMVPVPTSRGDGNASKPEGASGPSAPEPRPLLRLDREGPEDIGRVHPGWPGWLCPPGEPGSHREVQRQSSCPRTPSGVRPGWPGWLKPPGDPGLHQLQALDINDCVVAVRRSAPRMARVATAPRRPRVAPYHTARRRRPTRYC